MGVIVLPSGVWLYCLECGTFAWSTGGLSACVLPPTCISNDLECSAALVKRYFPITVQVWPRNVRLIPTLGLTPWGRPSPCRPCPLRCKASYSGVPPSLPTSLTPGTAPAISSLPPCLQGQLISLLPPCLAHSSLPPCLAHPRDNPSIELQYFYDIEPAMVTGNMTTSLWNAGNIYLDKVI